MKRVTVYVFFLAAVSGMACAGLEPQTPEAPAGGKSGIYRFAVAGGINVRDIPFQLALESLREQGYTIEIAEYAENELVPHGLVSGDADLASASTSLVWSAAAEGGEIHTILSAGSISWSLIAAKEIATCTDLDGVGVAFGGTQGVNPALLEAYVAERCPGTEPIILALGGSDARRAAMAAGELDATVLEIEDVLQLEKDAPGQFHELANFAQEFPNIFVSVFNVRREWGEENPEMVKDFIQAQLTAQRLINSKPQALEDALVRLLELEAEPARELAAAHLNPSIWDRNGGISMESVQYNLDFLAGVHSLPEDLRAEDVADLSYLNEVLDEIGRQ